MARVTGRAAHPAWIEVDVAALAHNAAVLRRATPPAARLGILVKAHGYGHGREMAARAALAGGADQLMVATLDEGLALRAAGIDAPILVVYPVSPDGVPDAVDAGLELSVGGVDGVAPLLAAWSASRERLPNLALRVHVEVDSGMGRGGVAPEDLVEVVRRLEAEPGTSLAAAWSHLADGRDPNRSRAQAQRFESALAGLARAGLPVPQRHLIASDGLFAETAPAYEMVRIGLAFYGELGLDPDPAPAKAELAAELRPAMTVKARAVRLESIAAGSSVGYGGEWTSERLSRIATLPIGYADGWLRSSWAGGSVLVRGRRAPQVGRVSMDSVCVDVTDIDGVTAADEFVLLGSQNDERISPAEIARHRGTIPNEVFCAFGPRLPRIYFDKGAIVATSRQDERVDRAPFTSG
jgi:alanine racemase